MSPNQTKADLPTTPHAQRWFLLSLLAVCALGLLLRAFMLAEFLSQNPIARTPIIDGWVYWQMAGRIAHGQILGDTPFLSAPLYPYVLGLLRAIGFGLSRVYVLQLLLHVGTAWFLGCIGRRRFNARVGLTAAALFLLLADPAFDSTRVLASTLQVLLVCLLWWQLLRAQERDTWTRWACAGALLGLLCLAYPAALLLVAMLGAWVWWRTDRLPGRITSTAVLVGGAALIIAPATLHNWWVTGGEFIPLTAHSGITFLQGNSPQARGVYRAVPGISTSRELMHYDAAAVYRQATGQPGSWREIDRFYRRQGLAFWKDHPTRALLLISKRVYLFLTARHYHEIHWPALEAQRGFGRLQKLAPVPTPWLMGLAVWGLIALRPDLRKYGSEWALFLLPLIVVAVFFYSPRYRIVAVPVVAVMSAWVVVRLWPTQDGQLPKPTRRWSAAAVALLLAGLLTGPLNRHFQIDHPAQDHGGFDFNLGVCLARQGHPEEAIEHLHSALEVNPSLFEARINLGITLASQDRLAQAESEFRRVLEAEPGSWAARWGLADVLARQNKPEQATTEYRKLVELRPDNATAYYKWGILLEAQGHLDHALRNYRRAVELAPDVEEFRQALQRASAWPERE